MLCHAQSPSHLSPFWYDLVDTCTLTRSSVTPMNITSMSFFFLLHIGYLTLKYSVYLLLIIFFLLFLFLSLFFLPLTFSTSIVILHFISSLPLFHLVPLPFCISFQYCLLLLLSLYISLQIPTEISTDVFFIFFLHRFPLSIYTFYILFSFPFVFYLFVNIAHIRFPWLFNCFFDFICSFTLSFVFFSINFNIFMVFFFFLYVT